MKTIDRRSFDVWIIDDLAALLLFACFVDTVNLIQAMNILK